MQDRPENDNNISKLIEIMRKLRDPDGGCPWDLEQDFKSISPYTIEEAYEVADAIDRGSRDDLREELGDLLFQVVYHARMAEEEGAFTFFDVVDAIARKMVRRHPHVFGDAAVRDAQTQTLAWEAIKARERSAKALDSVLDDVPIALPALTRADKIQKRAARAGFDWPDIDGVLDKIAEEAGELTREIEAGADAARVEDEIGDLLFTLVNLSRRLDTDPETALRAATGKFERRFRAVELLARERDIDLTSAGLPVLDRLWAAAKREHDA